MPGKRVLLAAEFLRGGATLTRLTALAVALADRGHDISLAVPGELIASVAPSGFPVFEAPRYATPPPPGYVALSYADLLMHGGYAAIDPLRGLMTGWQGVFEQAKPQYLIADFAPTAMLVARLTAIPMAAVGDGYSLPPLQTPLPDMRPWASVAPDAIASVEGRVLAVINARLGALRSRELRHLRDLFAGLPTYLCTFPELDHYTARAGGSFYGEVFGPSRGPAAIWPDGDGERVFVDLDPRHPALPAMIEALGRLALPTLIQGSGGLPDGLPGSTVQVTRTTNRASLLSGCDVVVGQGHDVVVPALLAGKPVLMLPVFVEQMMTLHRVAQQGLGHGIEPTADGPAIEAAIRRLVDDRGCRMTAVNFARTYQGYRPGIAIDAIADEIDEGLAA